MANYRCYTGPNAAGVPKGVIPDFLDHTANAITEITSNGTAACSDPGPSQPAAHYVNNTKVKR